ncbi:MAG: hypothetical protein BGO63_03865 [Candidatus Accumulibacter sp. 66-26]|nr:MAG: hypothetical protein BGO63_03865 [Candidatus Accumulibacter sp. 66-26]
METDNPSRIALLVQLAKSLLFFLLAGAAFVAVCWFMYARIWQPLTGFGVPLFLLATAVYIVIAYFLGWLPAVDGLSRVLRGQPRKEEI